MNLDIRVDSIMTRKPVTIGPDATVHDAAVLMRDCDVSSLIVLDEDGILAGLVSEWDIVKKTTSSLRDPAVVKVFEIMTPNVLTISPESTVEETLRVMGRSDVHRLPVVKDGRLVGLVTFKDVIKVSPQIIDLMKEWHYAFGNKDLDDAEERAETQFLNSA
ncbi:MAG: hypothetical protein CVT48_01525 [Thermoplasmata archaeon HGW-Thermoplasmata-1]|nr:MAG: hypothetical protein CVT48_01525 [Thermoplasmata archaeon HGW-Thermoplasmata-1]